MGSDELITEAETQGVPEWAWKLSESIVLGNQGYGNAAVLIHRAFTAQLAEARESERAALIEGAGELEVRLRARARLTDLQANQDAFLEAAASIAALKAEIERLTTVNTPCGPETHEKAVGWHLPTMLRWIDENRAATHMPSGDLVGTVLRIAAERIERLTEREAQVKLDGVRGGIEASVRALETDARLCDCFARSEGDCACGAWSDYKTVPMERAVDVVRALDAKAIAKGEG